MRRSSLVPVVTVVVTLVATAVVATLAVALPAAARPRPYAAPRPHEHRVARPVHLERGRPVQVGGLQLRPCDVAARALCGSVRRLWEPGHPSAGTLRVGFAFLPARHTDRPAAGTVVPHEGGPGYSTTGSAWGYRRMYGPLLRDHAMLLVDQRGTGLSQPVRCPDLQVLTTAYAVAAGRCGRGLGARADDYTTALSADDTAAVIRRLGLDDVDLYGDSYGTFFQQVFAGRHPGMVRSVVLDSAYPTYGETGWYPTQGPAVRRAFAAACDRAAACRDGGAPFLDELRAVLRQVRRDPWRGRGTDPDGRTIRVAVNPRNLATVAYGSTYTPTGYRELTAALRNALDGDRAPLLRLVAEAVGGSADAGPVAAYSEGLDAAVACHDYPQVYDMAAPPGAPREREYQDALTRRSATNPATFGPWRVREYARSDWEYLSWCTRWPTAPPDNPAAPPTPRGGSYPDVPVLVLSGELDTITTQAEGALVTSQFPDARQVTLANSFHVNASYDFEGCGASLVRSFTRDPGGALPGCASTVPPVRTLGSFPTSLGDVPRGTLVGAGNLPGRLLRTPAAAAAVVADVMDRWWSNYSGHGRGLRGGTWRYTGYQTVHFALRRVQLIDGHRVSGAATWDREAKTVTVDLRLGGRGPHGRLRGAWDTRAEGAAAVLRGHLDGTPVRVRVPAP